MCYPFGGGNLLPRQKNIKRGADRPRVRSVERRPLCKGSMIELGVSARESSGTFQFRGTRERHGIVVGQDWRGLELDRTAITLIERPTRVSLAATRRRAEDPFPFRRGSRWTLTGNERISPFPPSAGQENRRKHISQNVHARERHLEILLLPRSSVDVTVERSGALDFWEGFLRENEY